jgi:transposase
LNERAVRLVLQIRAETGERHGTVKRVAEQLDIGVESLRAWVRQHEINHGEGPGTTSEDLVCVLLVRARFLSSAPREGPGQE